MKKLLSLTLLLAIALFAFASCAQDTTKITVGVMNGPTGMGMAKLMSDSKGSEEYGFESYSDPTLGIADLASGKLNMLCLPTNTAANLATKQADYLTVIAINTAGSLYVVTDEANKVSSFSELDGKTIYTSVAASTTKPIVEYLIEKYEINAEIVVEKDHDTLVAKVKSGECPIAVLPEPKVTAGFMKNPEFSARINLSTEWDKVSDTPLAMGCIVVRNDFLKAHPGAVKRFLKDYEDSVRYISSSENMDASAALIAEAGILPNANVAKGALKNLIGSIVFIDGADMTETLKAFFGAIGQPLPPEEFYYD